MSFKDPWKLIAKYAEEMKHLKLPQDLPYTIEGIGGFYHSHIKPVLERHVYSSPLPSLHPQSIVKGDPYITEKELIDVLVKTHPERWYRCLAYLKAKGLWVSDEAVAAMLKNTPLLNKQNQLINANKFDNYFHKLGKGLVPENKHVVREGNARSFQFNRRQPPRMTNIECDGSLTTANGVAAGGLAFYNEEGHLTEIGHYVIPTRKVQFPERKIADWNTIVQHPYDKLYLVEDVLLEEDDSEGAEAAAILGAVRHHRGSVGGSGANLRLDNMRPVGVLTHKLPIPYKHYPIYSRLFEVLKLKWPYWTAELISNNSNLIPDALATYANSKANRLRGASNFESLKMAASLPEEFLEKRRFAEALVVRAITRGDEGTFYDSKDSFI